MAGTATGTLVAVGGPTTGPVGGGPTVLAVTGIGGASTSTSTLVAVGGPTTTSTIVTPQDAISTYCIGLYKAKKLKTELYKNNFKTDIKSINFRGEEFKYYPNITIEKVEKDTTDANHVLITIKGGNQEATMHYSGFKNLLNASPKELIENATIPSVELQGGTENPDINDFVEQITDYSYVPFCMIMQFYMNPDSILTKEYSPYELSLMSELTFDPKENKKGELMCDYNDTLIVGTDFLATPATTATPATPEIPPSIKTFDALKGIKLKKPASAPILKNGNYDINHSLIASKTIKGATAGVTAGGGLKSCRGTSCPNSNLPRIYRQVFERRTDYYNYA